MAELPKEPSTLALDRVAHDYMSWATGEYARVPLGFPIIDDRTLGGPATGEVVLFIAKSGVGKTIFGCNVAVNCRQVPTLFVSLEMHGRYILNRCAAIWSRQDTDQIEQHARQTRQIPPSVERFVHDFPDLTIADSPAQSLRRMSQGLDAHEEMTGQRPKLAIIDYMELIKGEGLADSAVESMDSLARKIKDWARREDLVVVVLHQLKKNLGAGFEPVTRDDARYGGDTQADYVISAYRPGLNPELPQDQRERMSHQFVIQFLKTRAGHELDLSGTTYHLDVGSLRLTPPQQQIDQGELQ